VNRLPLLLSALAISSVAFAQQPNVGVRVGVYFPTSEAVRNGLGDTWLSYGFNFGSVQTRDGQMMGGDTFFVSREARGNRLFMGTLSYGVTVPLGEYNRFSSFRPYVAVRGGITYADFRIGTTNGSNFTFNANAEVGVTLSDNFQIALRYDMNSRTRGFDLSGASITARYNLLSF
jgi:hypothetical protein